MGLVWFGVGAIERIEVTSTTSETAYYASLEIRGAPRPADLAKTLRFKKPPPSPPNPKKPPPIPQPEPVTTKFERCDDPTVPFLKESAPYELIDIQDGPALVEPEGAPIDVVEIDLQSMELLAASDLLSGDTIRSPGPLFEQPRTVTTRVWLVLAVVLPAAFAGGIALAYLALK